MNVEVLIANYEDPIHAADVTFLLNEYAKDPMGDCEELPDFVKQNLASSLAKIPHAFSVICYVDSNPAGLINCFEAFSTFKCQPLVNIHDIVVLSDFRGLKISHKMLEKVEQEALRRGCCKLTLEVLEGNSIARNAYNKFGFNGYELDPKLGKAMFWQKLI